MAIPHRESIPSSDDAYTILVTDDGSRTLVEVGSQQSFHSGCGAIAETREVYLRNSGALERLEAGRSTTVLEVGVGTTMAMLMTLDAAVNGGAPLRYVGLEKHWISGKVLEQLQPQGWIERPVILQRYLDWRNELPERVPDGEYIWTFDAVRKLTVVIGDAVNWAPDPRPTFDAIYFDPFAPECQPELWDTPMLAKMHSMLDAEGTLVTYCVSRSVRQSMEQVGFDVERIAGPVGGKREVLVARPQRPPAGD